MFSYESRDQGTLSDQLTCIELSNDTFEYFIHNRRKNSFIIIRSQSTINRRKFINSGTRQHTTGNIHHLKILPLTQETGMWRGGTFCSGERSDIARFCTDIIDDGGFEPGDIEMGAFLVDVSTHPADPFILDCSMSSVN